MILHNKSKVIIADSAMIHESVCIGEVGYGYDTDEHGNHILQEHNFGVVIGPYVDIRSNVSIHQGRWRDTVIEAGTKIDSGAHIAHNCIIGKNCFIGAGAKLGGSVTVGEGTHIWMNATIHQGITIGKNCAVGAGTYLRKDVPDNHVAYNTGNGTIIKHKKDTKRYGNKSNLV